MDRLTAGFNRAVQMTEEKLGDAEKTPYDSDLQDLMDRGEKVREWTKKIADNTEVLFQPNPNSRMEDFVSVHLEKMNVGDVKALKPGERVTTQEVLGQQMMGAGYVFGAQTPYGHALIKMGESERMLGEAERVFITNASSTFLKPIQQYLNEDFKIIAKEKKTLEDKRLDLDVAKTKRKKATKPQQAEAAEAEVKFAQTNFDEQGDRTRSLLEDAIAAQTKHHDCLKEFLGAQLQYYTHCADAMKKLSQELSGFGLAMYKAKEAAGKVSDMAQGFSS